MAVAEESWTKKYLGEVLGVFVLVFLGDSFVAYAVAGGKNGFLAGLLGAGFFWGFAVTLAIYACGAVSGAHLNPAREFGPRLWMLVVGYGTNAIPGPNFHILITTLMPLIGGPLGAYIYDYIVHQHLPVPVGPDVAEVPATEERARARA